MDGGVRGRRRTRESLGACGNATTTPHRGTATLHPSIGVVQRQQPQRRRQQRRRATERQGVRAMAQRRNCTQLGVGGRNCRRIPSVILHPHSCSTSCNREGAARTHARGAATKGGGGGGGETAARFSAVGAIHVRGSLGVFRAQRRARW